MCASYWATLLPSTKLLVLLCLINEICFYFVFCCGVHPRRQEEPDSTSECVRPEAARGQPTVPEETGEGHSGCLVAVWWWRWLLVILLCDHYWSQNSLFGLLLKYYHTEQVHKYWHIRLLVYWTMYKFRLVLGFFWPASVGHVIYSHLLLGLVDMRKI